MRRAVVVAFAASLVGTGAAGGQQSQTSRASAIERWIIGGIEGRAALFQRIDAGASSDSGWRHLRGLPGSDPLVRRVRPSLTVSQSAIPDRWFARDKVRHFFTSAMLQSLGYGTLRAMDVEHGAALAGASAVTAGFGIGKELSDRRRGYGFSVRDLVWDAAGAAAVSVLLARTER